jgi:hypothetical protein
VSAVLAVHLHAAVPDEFPTFTVPGFERDMETLRELFWLHYPGAGPKSTLWDEWLSMSSLWPASAEQSRGAMRRDWARVLSSRFMDPEGYVATHQHPSIAHQLGWPFPFYSQGKGGFGWHFSFKDTVNPPLRPTNLNIPDSFKTEQLERKGICEEGWKLRVTGRDAYVTCPMQRVDTFNAPFI